MVTAIADTTLFYISHKNLVRNV